MKTLKKIEGIAVKVRQTCEKLADDELSMTMDFNGMADLSCMCACASWILRNELRRNGIRASVIWGEFIDHNGKIAGGHCWVKWKDWFIDLTAAQFEWFFDDVQFADVMIFNSKKDEDTSQYYYNYRPVRRLDEFNEWPDGQNPLCFIDKKVRKFVRENMDSV